MTDVRDLYALPTDQAPTDREWTDLEWVRNQWWMAEQVIANLEPRLADAARRRDECDKVACDLLRRAAKAEQERDKAQATGELAMQLAEKGMEALREQVAELRDENAELRREGRPSVR